MNQKLPENFNWVSVRAECSPTAAFLKLRSQENEDIDDTYKTHARSGITQIFLHFSSRRGVEILGLGESSALGHKVFYSSAVRMELRCATFQPTDFCTTDT